MAFKAVRRPREEGDLWQAVAKGLSLGESKAASGRS